MKNGHELPVVHPGIIIGGGVKELFLFKPTGVSTPIRF